ncbi:hypothetical protein [Alkaliphilus hydrothermalis]|uniref:Radical SAM superfamily enzyme YgiQ, UPF0313 family n=1 Tax=Alkaliphilus hydrothermalis TaxID=1482730 RepID=A0ABS2NT87_9FIRM|nr:hypothetical protein [Alkaliphilus hydrothermalis]MBM7616162.1 hypothetical protein [Alkaliphilus hydrothermalis]
MHILLVEPDYKNKYPPMGLMKISSYHKSRGDYVLFYKGKLNNSRIWDRIYITTLFTFDYKKVVDTINFYKSQVTSLDNIYVGGIMASILYKDLSNDTGLQNILVGRLTYSEMIGFDDNVNIDQLPLDYDILNDIQYKYPAGDNFFAYTSRGCVNKCSFCAVPFLEGKLDITNDIRTQISTIRDKYGDKRNLLLLDNNILGLKEEELEKIVNDLNELGFVKEPNYVKPLKVDVLVKAYYRHIEEGRSPINIMTEFSLFLHKLQEKKLSKSNRKIIKDIISDIGTIYEDEIQCILDNYDKIREIEKKYSYKIPVQRYVDFNQGLDARELTEDKMKILSRLPIRPFRIAYDDISFTDIYTRALTLAHKYDASEFSNYILYNYNDKPEDLYKRLEKNLELSEEFNKHIYSFPMKYEAINQKSRTYVGVYWNKHYLKIIKAILNVSKGVFGGDRSFFEKAFGKNIEEYYEILSMPKDLVTYRMYFEKIGVTAQWKKLYNGLTINEKIELINLVSNGDYDSNNKKLIHIMPYYKIDYKNIIKKESEILMLDNGDSFNL